MNGFALLITRTGKVAKVLLSPTVTCRSLEGLRRLSPPLYSDRFLISIFYSTRRYRHLRETAIAWNRKTVINSLLVIGINLQIPGCKSNCHSLYFQNSGVVFINHVVICINHDLVCTNHVVVYRIVAYPRENAYCLGRLYFPMLSVFCLYFLYFRGSRNV